MSNLITPVDPGALAAVTAGASTARCTPANGDLLQTLNTLSSTLQNIGKASSSSGFSTTEILMLGFMMNQNRNHQVNVIVRRPYWW